MRRYRTNSRADVAFLRDSRLDKACVTAAIQEYDEVYKKFSASEVDVAELLGLRNLSSFIGELFASRIKLCTGKMFEKNPHQDGYPDLLLMDDVGRKEWGLLRNRLREKKPFSPFPTGGLEVKATCGTTPTPAQCARRGLQKPGLGDARLPLLSGYDWKAHHQKTNYLLGIFWDFIDGAPSIIAVFYSAHLTREDWGAVIQPREGGGNTTSLSIMTRAGVRKMCQNWLVMIDEPGYREFFSRYNGVPLSHF